MTDRELSHDPGRTCAREEAVSAAELPAAEQGYRALIENIRDIAYSMNTDGVLTFLGPQAGEYGIAPGSAVSRPFADLVSPEDRERVADSVQQSLTTGTDVSVEFRLAGADGSSYWFEKRGGIVRDASGEVVGASGILRDITERKKTELAAQEKSMRLGASLDELRSAQDEVIQYERLSALRQMASGIAHDFNNVLMPILGFTELMTSDPNILNDKDGAMRMIEMIHSAGNDARHVVRRLRAVYKRNDDLVCKLVDLGRIVESAASLTMPRWKEEMRASGIDIEIVTDFQPVPKIMGNESELREVLVSLILNATDAMQEDGTITFRLFSDTDSVVLEVQNTGPGMDEQTARRCMEPFFTTKDTQGSGLGLAMVYGIVERHGGSMAIESEPETGTTVRIRLPIPSEKKDLEDDTAPQPPVISNLRVLAIDDEKRVRQIIYAMLKADGHYPEVVESGQEGIDAIQQQDFDLVIVDRAMPCMSGDEVAAAVHKIRPEIPVIMLTGFGDIMKDRGECPVGVSRIMTKPITFAELRRFVESVMRDKRR